MDNNNIYNIKLNAGYLAKWIRYIFIITIVTYIINFLSAMADRAGAVGSSLFLDYISLALGLVTVFCLYKLAVVEKAFGKAGILFATASIIGLLVGFIPEPKLLSMPQITMMLLMIAPAPINLLAEYVEHGGFVNILKGLDDSLVKKWDILWNVFLPTNIVLIITAIISIIYINNVEAVAGTVAALAIIGSIGAIFCFVYKLYILNKTANFFNNMEI